jgi:hypothetical protein
MKEIRFNYDEISDPQKITEVIDRKYREAGLNIHVNEVCDREGLIDDDDKRQRIIRIKNRKYFFMK